MRGFTLIELLAVIVILSIILLIAIPLIGNVIEASKKSAFESSAKGYMEAAKLAYVKNEVNGTNDNLVYEYIDGVPTGLDIEYSGTKPQDGIIMVSKGKVSFVLHNGKYCATKSANSSDVTVTEMTKDDCNISLIVLRPTAVITMTPDENLTNLSTIVFDYNNSVAYDGKTIVSAEWDNKQDTYAAGEHTVKLRVLDSEGVYSQWVEKTFTVETAPIVLNPATGNDLNDGYTTSVKTLTKALELVADGGTIYIKGNLTLNVTIDFTLYGKDVTLKGDYVNDGSTISGAFGFLGGDNEINIIGIYLNQSGSGVWSEIFIYNENINIYNSVVREAGTTYSNVYYDNGYYFENCLIIRTGSIYDHSVYKNTAFAQATVTGDYELINSITGVTYDAQFSLTSGTWSNAGLMDDGVTPTHIGVYGGKYAWSN